MGKGIINEIEAAILRGETREELNNKYNKATVTKAFNKLNRDNSMNKPNAEDNTEKIQKVLNQLVKLLCNSPKYKINVLVEENTVLQQKENVKLINPFDLYDEKNKDSMILKLSKMDQKYLIKIIKKYFKYSGKTMNQFTNIELARYICNEVENVMNIGKCFR